MYLLLLILFIIKVYARINIFKVYKEKQLMLTLTYNHYIQNKIKNRLPMKARNYACFKLEKKATIGVKKNRKNYRRYRR